LAAMVGCTVFSSPKTVAYASAIIVERLFTGVRGMGILGSSLLSTDSLK
jgi:hypothetical protein